MTVKAILLGVAQDGGVPQAGCDCPTCDQARRHPVHRQSVVCLALLDATFFSPAELPGRALSQIPHPLVSDTVTRLAGVASDIQLIHLNHTNPLLLPGPERAWLATQGLKVGRTGAWWVLG